jgi:hypothetical protein
MWSGTADLPVQNEDRTLARLRALRSDLIDPTIAVARHQELIPLKKDIALAPSRF